MKVTIQINDNKKEYEVWWTNAPEDYDWFGAFTLHKQQNLNGKKGRVVLIPVERVVPQTQRYGSGLHLARKIEEEFPGTEHHYKVDEYLFKKLMGVDLEKEFMGV